MGRACCALTVHGLFKPPKRSFGPLISYLDTAAEAGGVLTAYKRKCDLTTKDGFVELAFKPSKGNAVVSAIEVE